MDHGMCAPEGWVGMVGEDISLPNGGTRILFSFGLSTESVTERHLGTWNQNHWIKLSQGPSYFCSLSYMRKSFCLGQVELELPLVVAEIILMIKFYWKDGLEPDY